MAKTVEQKLFEAFTSGGDLLLSAADVQALVGPDDAIGTRISNMAAREAGEPEPGQDGVPRNGQGMSWVQFKRLFATPAKGESK